MNFTMWRLPVSGRERVGGRKRNRETVKNSADVWLMGVKCQGWPLIFAAWIHCSKTTETAHTAKTGSRTLERLSYNRLIERQPLSVLWDCSIHYKPIWGCCRSNIKAWDPANVHVSHLHEAKSIGNQLHKCNVWCMAFTSLVPSLLCQYVHRDLTASET